MSKYRTQFVKIYSTYQNTKISILSVVLYIIIIDSVLVYKASLTSDSLDTAGFIAYLFFSTLAVFNLYGGMTYYTAWTNYRKRQK